MYFKFYDVMDFGRSARRKNNVTDGRAAVDREGEKKNT